MTKNTFLLKARDAAKRARHPYPDYAACEAALESAWGTSTLVLVDNNLFGMKQHTHRTYGTHILPTREYLGGKWTVVEASWVKYPDWASCFADRILTLEALAPKYKHYANALASTTGEEFIREVSATWSTDPKRADKVLATYQAHRQIFLSSPQAG